MLPLVTCQNARPLPLAESGPDSANERRGVQLAAFSDMENAASCDLLIEASALALAESGPDSTNGRGRPDVD